MVRIYDKNIPEGVSKSRPGSGQSTPGRASECPELETERISKLCGVECFRRTCGTV
jgi:hypothetical protein